MAEKAVVLLSGGLDSSTCLAIAKQEGYDVYAMTILYGQRHSKEITSAMEIGKHFGVVEHKNISLDMRLIGGSSLTDNMDVEKRHPRKEIPHEGVPNTYVPMRNAVFLAIAASWAEVLKADHVFTGVNQVDYSNYPDCDGQFIDAVQVALATGSSRWREGMNLSIDAPLLNLTKVEIVKLGTELGVPWGKTWSCYNGRSLACGQCDSCVFRLKGFAGAGLADPLPYA